MANYSLLKKILMNDSANRKDYAKSKSPFHESSWIHEKETPKVDTKNLKIL